MEPMDLGIAGPWITMGRTHRMLGTGKPHSREAHDQSDTPTVKTTGCAQSGEKQIEVFNLMTKHFYDHSQSFINHDEVRIIYEN